VEACALPAGPFSAAALATAGAKVLKLELSAPEGNMRSEGDCELPQGFLQPRWSSSEPQILGLDLTKPSHQNVLDQLVKECDCLIHSFRATSAERLSLGKERLEQHPQLLVVSLSGLQSLAQPAQPGRASLFAFEGIVQGEADTCSPSVQRISSQVAVQIVSQNICSIRAGKCTSRLVRVSVTGPG